MANQKLTALTENESPALEDLVYSVDDPSVSPLSRKVTLQNVMELAPYWVDRGDPSAADFRIGDLTADGAYHDMDLSSIVPAGATQVRLGIFLSNSQGAGQWKVRFRKNGNSNSHHAPMIRTSVANLVIDGSLQVFCDSSRVIEYQLENDANYTQVDITVLGWFIDTVN